MGLDTRTSTSLWKDKAMIEANVAVLHSFQVWNRLFLKFLSIKYYIIIYNFFSKLIFWKILQWKKIYSIIFTFFIILIVVVEISKFKEFSENWKFKNYTKTFEYGCVRRDAIRTISVILSLSFITCTTWIE